MRLKELITIGFFTVQIWWQHLDEDKSLKIVPLLDMTQVGAEIGVEELRVVFCYVEVNELTCWNQKSKQNSVMDDERAHLLFELLFPSLFFSPFVHPSSSHREKKESHLFLSISFTHSPSP